MIWSISSGDGYINSTGVLQAGETIAPIGVHASAAGLTQDTTVDVANFVPVLTTQPYADASVITGDTIGLHAMADEDGFGDGNIRYRWSETSGPAGSVVSFSSNSSRSAASTVATFDEAGDYVFSVHAIDIEGETAIGTVKLSVAQKATTLAVAPAASVASLTSPVIGLTQTPLAASALDQFGNAMATPAVAWSIDGGSIGSVSTAGVYTAPNAAGTVIARATADDGATGTATFAVKPASTPIAVAAFSSQPVAADYTGVLRAALSGVADDPNVTYTWTVLSQPSTLRAATARSARPVVSASANLVTFTANGTHAAKTTAVAFTSAGTYTLQVQANDGISIATSVVTVSVHSLPPTSKLASVAGYDVTANAGGITGYVIHFNRALDPVSAQNVRAYSLGYKRLASKGRDFFENLFGAGGGKQLAYTPVPIASAVYDPATYTVTLTLANPLSAFTRQDVLQVFGSGKNAIKDASGVDIDGNHNGKPGGTSTYAAAVKTGTKISLVDGDAATPPNCNSSAPAR